MKRNLLLTPGPVHVPAQICEALGRPIIHHRTPQFQAILKEVTDGLKYVFQTKSDNVFILTSSGTGAMEASVCNLLSPGDKAITVEGGKFGERWTELCKAYAIQPHVIQVKWGLAVTPAQIQQALNADKDIKAVFVTLSETSTCVTTDIKAIAEVVKKTNTVLVVDAISGLGVVDIQMDNWGVDVIVSGSQKGLMLPPGLAFIAMSSKAMDLVGQSTCPKYYFSLKAAKKAAEKTDTPYTPAVGIIIALATSLKMIREAGLENLFAHYAKLAKATQAAAKALNLKLVADPSCASNAVTGIFMPDGIEGEKLVKTMRDTYGVVLAGGQGDFTGKIARIAHMGAVDEWDILTGISCLEKVLKQMGYKFSLGAGVAAAQNVFNS